MQLATLFLLTIVASLAEVMTLGAVLPFLAVLMAPEKIHAHNWAQPIIQLFQIQSAHNLPAIFTSIFAMAAVLAALARLALLWWQTRVSIDIAADFSIQVYERTLYQPYSVHISRNSSDIISGSQKAKEMAGVFIQPIILASSSILMMLAIVITLVAIEPVAAIIALLGFGLVYVAFALLTRPRILKNSEAIAICQTKATKTIQEGLGGIRDVIIDGTQKVYSRLYMQSFLPMQTAIASNQVWASSPRFGVEALGITLIAGLAYFLTISAPGENTVPNPIPVLAALALGAQRILPMLQQIYASYITIKGNQASIEDALDLLDQPVLSHKPTLPVSAIEFKASITLKNVGYRYDDKGPWVLRNLNLQIHKGDRVGFVGMTGSGKSTLLDIVMGLLTPTEGKLLIDNIEINCSNNRSWQSLLSHVPQTVYLADASIAENIAFGIPSRDIDLQKVKEACKHAQIDRTIESWVAGYDTLVGERGIRLSGGQRQRIGIARALYKRAGVLIFDEATSALDNDTESAVIKSIEKLASDVTILMVAHRITTLERCDKIVRVANGSIVAIESYTELTRDQDLNRVSREELDV